MNYAQGNIFGRRPVRSFYYNDYQEYTAVCPEGTTGDSVRVTAPAGSFYSETSVDDANALALAALQASAEAQLTCTTT